VGVTDGPRQRSTLTRRADMPAGIMTSLSAAVKAAFFMPEERGA
jgi:hypothetical protein